MSFVAEQAAHQQPVEIGEFFFQTARDTLENWQSEFLQLIWQVGGLACFLHIGSQESDERKEEKLDRILRVVDKEARAFIQEVDLKYQRE